jgi:glycosyltransferase involved in cell wall biosynthesis
MYEGLHAGERRGIPVVATPCLHAGEPGSSDVARHYLGAHQLEMLRRSQKVLCMTEVERKRFETLGLPSQRMAIAPHGVDVRAASGGDPEFLRKAYGVDGPVILHLGMKAYEKGSETTVEAMKLLWAKGSNAWLVMAGPSLSTFDSYIAHAGENLSRFLNLPPYGEEEKRNLLASATLVAQPSRVESLGLVLIEAWANRKPVIAADIDVSRALVDGSGGGSIVPFGNASRLAGEMERMLDDSKLREAAGSGGYASALDYDGDACWERTLREFEDVVSNAKQNR